ncbi:Hypothetical protein POVR1_LOCUS577 [uncultured virus]|nr:Hypothetical protein POVR1_LOCUS577 [uncultured virus]
MLFPIIAFEFPSALTFGNPDNTFGECYYVTNKKRYELRALEEFHREGHDMLNWFLGLLWVASE